MVYFLLGNDNYEISFPLTFIFKYNYVKILLLMTFISISISLKSSKFLENKSHVSERGETKWLSVHLRTKWFESSCSHFTFRFHACFEQEVP